MQLLVKATAQPPGPPHLRQPWSLKIVPPSNSSSSSKKSLSLELAITSNNKKGNRDTLWTLPQERTLAHSQRSMGILRPLTATTMKKLLKATWPHSNNNSTTAARAKATKAALFPTKRHREAETRARLCNCSHHHRKRRHTSTNNSNSRHIHYQHHM